MGARTRNLDSFRLDPLRNLHNAYAEKTPHVLRALNQAAGGGIPRFPAPKWGRGKGEIGKLGKAGGRFHYGEL